MCLYVPTDLLLGRGKNSSQCLKKRMLLPSMMKLLRNFKNPEAWGD
uniref:Uncharacterized protein n=1 Tax=viral metagenome TaxID=1070528 RepID=A0A6C0AKG6_9ZZZZ